jgi:hypothetical protein
MAKRQRSTYVLPEPKWREYKEYTDEADREKAFSDCEYFTHYEVADKSGVPHIKKWMKANFPVDDVTSILKSPDSTFHSIAKYGYIWSKLGYMTHAHETYLHSIKDDLIAKGNAYVADKEEAPKAKVVSIRKNLDDFLDGVEDAEVAFEKNRTINIETFVEGYKLNATELTTAYTKLDEMAFEWRELLALRNLKGELSEWDQQLVEGYSHLKLSTIKKLVDFYSQLQTGLLETKQSKKIVRIRRKKPTDKNKVVRRLKYLKDFPELKLKSVDPVDIIGASEVWVYDTARKKIGVYASEYEGTLSVKGASIDNYSDAKSYEKTMRKPEVQVPEFMAARKNGLHKYVDTIRGKKLAPRKRLLPSMIILRVI